MEEKNSYNLIDAAYIAENLAQSKALAESDEDEMNRIITTLFPPAKGAVLPSAELYYQLKQNRRYGKVQKPKK